MTVFKAFLTISDAVINKRFICFVPKTILYFFNLRRHKIGTSDSLELLLSINIEDKFLLITTHTFAPDLHHTISLNNIKYPLFLIFINSFSRDFFMLIFRVEMSLLLVSAFGHDDHTQGRRSKIEVMATFSSLQLNKYKKAPLIAGLIIYRTNF
ncbi:hypothetical protein [Bacillus sp. Hm123]|uniref:hypothetical protein n=1 Tax=Bacillus sp. Hm123 TaxID=3450745 RepID=UPI003F43B985